MTTEQAVVPRNRRPRGQHPKPRDPDGQKKPSKKLPEYLEAHQVEALIRAAPNPRARLLFLIEWRYSSRMGDEWQRGAMVRAGFRVDGSGGGLQQPRGDLVAVCERWQGEMAGRGRSKRHSRTGVARVCGAVG